MVISGNLLAIVKSIIVKAPMVAVKALAPKPPGPKSHARAFCVTTSRRTRGIVVANKESLDLFIISVPPMYVSVSPQLLCLATAEAGIYEHHLFQTLKGY